MPSSTYFAVICFLLVLHYNYAAPIELFPGFLRNININTPDKTDDIVKRRVYEENPDAELKQISLQSLIGDLEDSLFQSALSVSSIAGSDDAVVEEVTPKSDEHTVNKRSTDDKPADTDKPTTPIPQEISIARTASVDDIIPILQHTQKIPEKEGVPAHIVIDRISIQPHHGSLPLIPAFQVQHTKVKAAAITEDGSKVENVKVTKISFSDPSALTSTTEKSDEPSSTVTTSKPVTPSDASPKEIVTVTGGITGTITTQHVESTVLLAVTPTPATDASSVNTSTSVVTAISSSTPTQAPIKELKEAEKELKEKVAEIEAEPVILSSRV